jgi:hypothetical protein
MLKTKAALCAAFCFETAAIEGETLDGGYPILGSLPA